MPKEVVSMRIIEEVLRVCLECGWSERAAARSCALSRSTVAKYLARARVAGFSWLLPEGLDDEALEHRLFPAGPAGDGIDRYMPDWAEVHWELKRRGVTLQLLWEEYKQTYPDGYQYSRFTERYRAWRGELDLPMRQNHKAGEKLFVDYCGQTLPITDRATGRVRQAQIFVAVLGNYTFAEAFWTQSLPEWITAHVYALRFLDGVPSFLVYDSVPSHIIRTDAAWNSFKESECPGMPVLECLRALPRKRHHNTPSQCGSAITKNAALISSPGT